MSKHNRPFLALGILLTLYTSQANARTRDSAWNIGIPLEHMNYELGSDKLRGNRGGVSFGYGKILQNLAYSLNLDIYLGPYTTLHDNKVKVDFYGTGVSSKVAYAFMGSDLRAPGGSGSFDLGLSYSDTVGRSTSPGLIDNDTKTITKLTTRLSQFAALCSLSYNKFLPSREHNNSPESLLTRIEGYTTSVGLLYPIKSTFKTRYTEELNQKADDKKSSRERANRGHVRGFSVFVSVLIYLGV